MATGVTALPTHSIASELGDLLEFGEDPGSGEGGWGHHESLSDAAVLCHQPHVAHLGRFSFHDIQLPTWEGRQGRLQLGPPSLLRVSVPFLLSLPTCGLVTLTCGRPF